MATTQFGGRVPLPRSWWVALALLGGSFLAVALAVVGTGLGATFVFAALFALVLVVAVVITRAPTRVIFVLMVLSIQFLLFRTVGDLRLTHGGGAGTFYITSTMALLALLYLLWLTEPQFVPELVSTIGRFPVVVALGPILVGTLSLINSQDLFLTFAQLLNASAYFLLFIYVIAHIRTERDVLWVVALLLATAAFQGAVGMGQFLTRSNLGFDFLGSPPSALARTYSDIKTYRVPGTILHANIYGPFLALLAAFPICTFVATKSRAVRFACLISGALLAFGLAASVSRGGLTAFAVTIIIASLLVLVVFRPRFMSVVLSGLAILVLAALVWIPFHDEISVRVQQDPKAIQARLEQYQLAGRMLAAHPLIGVGLNTYQENVETYLTAPILIPLAPAHGYYAAVMAETGALGIMAFGALMLTLFWSGAVALRHRSRIVKAAAVASLAGFAGLLFSEVAEFNLRFDTYESLFWLIAGLVVALPRIPLVPSTVEVPGSR